MKRYAGSINTMTVENLIQLLSKAHPKDVVKAYNGDTEQLEEVSGMLYGGDDNVVELCTDDMGG